MPRRPTLTVDQRMQTETEYMSFVDTRRCLPPDKVRRIQKVTVLQQLLSDVDETAGSVWMQQQAFHKVHITYFIFHLKGVSQGA